MQKDLKSHDKLTYSIVESDDEAPTKWSSSDADGDGAEPLEGSSS